MEDVRYQFFMQVLADFETSAHLRIGSDESQKGSSQNQAENHNYIKVGIIDLVLSISVRPLLHVVVGCHRSKNYADKDEIE